ILEPEITALALDDSTRGEEADARSGNVVVRDAACVRLEDARAVLRRDSGAFVPHTHDRAVVGALDAHRDACPLRRVLRRVVHETGDDLRRAALVPADEQRLTGTRTAQPVPPRHRRDLF